MENKKLGLILIAIGLIVGGLFFYYTIQLTDQGEEIGCFPQDADCSGIQRALNFSHISIGVFSFILALGFYLIFFNKTEAAILNKLESDKNEKIQSIKFNTILNALDSYEKKVLEMVKDQPGITQNTLRIKSDMSKAKLSYVLKELEKRNLIKRVEKGKTLQIYLKI